MVSFAFWEPGTELSWAPGSGEYHRHVCTLEQSGSHQGSVWCGFALYVLSGIHRGHLGGRRLHRLGYGKQESQQRTCVSERLRPTAWEQESHSSVFHMPQNRINVTHRGTCGPGKALTLQSPRVGTEGIIWQFIGFLGPQALWDTCSLDFNLRDSLVPLSISPSPP